MSRSRIFLRKVLRLTPSRSAARIWLPRVAVSAAVSSGNSTSRRMPLDRAREGLVRARLLGRRGRHRRLSELALDDGGGDGLLRIERGEPAREVLQFAYVAGPAVALEP